MVETLRAALEDAKETWLRYGLECLRQKYNKKK
jgi:hypothetical protein